MTLLPAEQLSGMSERLFRHDLLWLRPPGYAILTFTTDERFSPRTYISQQWTPRMITMHRTAIPYLFYFLALTYSSASADSSNCRSLQKNATQHQLIRCNIEGSDKIHEGKLDEALAIANTLVRVAPHDYHSFLLRSDVYGFLDKSAPRVRDLESAEKIITKDISKDSRNATLYSERGSIRRQLNSEKGLRIDKAVEDYQKALELDPSNKGYRRSLENLKEIQKLDN